MFPRQHAQYRSQAASLLTCCTWIFFIAAPNRLLPIRCAMRGGPATARAAAALACPAGGTAALPAAPSDPVPAPSAAFSTFVVAMVGSGVEPRERARDAEALLGAWAGLGLAEAVSGRAPEEGMAALGVTTADAGMTAPVSFAGASLLGAGWFTGAACGSWGWGAVGLTGSGRERPSPSGVDGAEDVGMGAGSVGLDFWDAGVGVGSEACSLGLCDGRPNTMALPFLLVPVTVSRACDAATPLVVVVVVFLHSLSGLAGCGAAVVPASAELVMGGFAAGLGSLQLATR